MINKKTKKNLKSAPVIIAAETSGRFGSIAIGIGEKLLAKKKFSAAMRHSAEMFPAIEELLNKAAIGPDQIDQVYITSGPGSFTGLRIAVTMAKMMHLARRTPIVTVNTLDVIARNVLKKPVNLPCDRFAVILDAKRGQFYTAVYHLTEQGNLVKELPDTLMRPGEFLDKYSSKLPVALLGEGLVHYKDRFAAEGISFMDESYWYPDAENVHLLGWEKAQASDFADPVALTPLYLRKPDAKVKKRT